MRRSFEFLLRLLVSACLVACWSDPAQAQISIGAELRARTTAPAPNVPRMAARPVDGSSSRPAPSGSSDASAAAGQHPLQPAVDRALRAQERIRSIRDYSCVLVKRERIRGKLTPYESMFLKVRHEPFSVYLYCLGPTKPKGQEAIYVEGRNNNQVLAHSTGLKKIVGTLSLEPTSPRMMEGNLYPITNIGIQNMVQRMIVRETAEMGYSECEVKFYPGAKVDGRLCTCVEIVHPVPRSTFKNHRTRIFYDEELQIPIRVENCGWPSEAGSEPPIMEEYTYRKLQLNPGLSDRDFDPANPAYQFE